MFVLFLFRITFLFYTLAFAQCFAIIILSHQLCNYILSIFLFTLGKIHKQFNAITKKHFTLEGMANFFII